MYGDFHEKKTHTVHPKILWWYHMSAIVYQITNNSTVYSREYHVLPQIHCSTFIPGRSHHVTRELTEICITSCVQKVWVVEFVNGHTEIPQWPFLSVPVRAFEIGVCPKLHLKTVKITFSRTSTKPVPNFSWLHVDYGFQVLKYRKWCKTNLRTTYRGCPGNI